MQKAKKNLQVSGINRFIFNQNPMQTKEELILENKELFWDIGNISKLDDLAVEERFLKYGNWKNIKDMIEVFGLERLKNDYVKIRDKKRTELSKKTINFFNLYFDV